MTSGHIRATYGSTTCSWWRRWTASSQDSSPNCTLNRSWVPSREMTSRLSRRRSEWTKSCCQCSVASLLNSSNCFSTHSTSVHSHMSATSSLADQVCTNISRQKCSNAAISLNRYMCIDFSVHFSVRGVVRVSLTKKNRMHRTTRTTRRTTRPNSLYEVLMGVSTPVSHPSWVAPCTIE